MKTAYKILITISILCSLTSFAYCDVDGKISLALQWQPTDGKIEQKDFGTVPVKQILGEGFWVAFKQDRQGTLPGIYMKDEFVSLSAPIEKMKSLTLIIRYEEKTGSLEKDVVIFSEDRLFGSRKVTPENVYHVLVLADTPADGNTPPSFEPSTVAEKSWRGPFGRMHRLALNYAQQSDAKRREYEKIFGVQTKYETPRLIVAAEEWLDIPKEVQKKKKSSGGLFGGALDSVADEISGEPEVTVTKIPVYSINVLLDEIEVNGKYSMGFEAARSSYNDILEGKVIYEATGGSRKVITASGVFSQLQKNKSTRGSENRILQIDANSLAELDNCKNLWPAAKKAIKDFLGKKKDWKVIIPAEPVTFYENDKPIYAMYAWFRVHPASGRMIGLLPNNMHGAVSDEMARLEETLIDKAREKVGAQGGAVRVLFSQVAGMYVSSAGVLDGVSMTICDPNLANMDDEQWRKFLTNHSLDFCQQFLEDNADDYGNYAQRLAFWQGAMVIAHGLGGIEGAQECAKRAVKDAVNKAIDDVKAKAKEQLGKMKGAAKEKARAKVGEIINEHAPDVGRFAEGVEALGDAYDKVVDTKDTIDDYTTRANAVYDEIREKFQ
jgi:hypothetical protein